MWLAGYWMERGYRPEEIFAMPRMEQGIMQAIAELNRGAVQGRYEGRLFGGALYFIARKMRWID